MTLDQYRTAAIELATGTHGSFAGHIGRAYLVADTDNAAALRAAFPDLFDRAHRWAERELRATVARLSDALSETQQ